MPPVSTENSIREFRSGLDWVGAPLEIVDDHPRNFKPSNKDGGFVEKTLGVVFLLLLFVVVVDCKPATSRLSFYRAGA